MKYRCSLYVVLGLFRIVNCFVAFDFTKRSIHRPPIAFSTTSIQMNTAAGGESLQRINTKRRKLPEGNLIVGYANWNQCDEKIMDAVVQGVNVVIWFSINLLVDEHGRPRVENGPDMKCVASMVKRIRDMGLECVHLISVGGWNSPHPDTTNSAEVVFQAWHEWNTVTIADPTQGFFGFDGFDW